MNDGKTQISFTLPVPAGEEAIEAAKLLMKKWDLRILWWYIIKN